MTEDADPEQELVGGGYPLAEKKKWVRPKRKKPKRRVRTKPDRKK